MIGKKMSKVKETKHKIILNQFVFVVKIIVKVVFIAVF